MVRHGDKEELIEVVVEVVEVFVFCVRDIEWRDEGDGLDIRLETVRSTGLVGSGGVFGFGTFMGLGGTDRLLQWRLHVSVQYLELSNSNYL